MPRLPTIYTARSDVETAHLARVEDWYARRHAPDLIRAGFYTAQVYYSEVGTPRICNLYEIPGPDLFVTQGYRDVAAKDTEGPAVIALLTSRSNTIYDQVLTVNVPAVDVDWAAGGRAGGVVAPALSTVRFELRGGGRGRAPRVVPVAGVPATPGSAGLPRGAALPAGSTSPGGLLARSPLVRHQRVGGCHGGDGRWNDEGGPGAARSRDSTGRLSRFAYNVGRRHFQLARTAV